ncbi:MAG: bifunctional isocitrate dehydrogenase kinase/phosphatase [Cyclobacteriaceae bacterium]
MTPAKIFDNHELLSAHFTHFFNEFRRISAGARYLFEVRDWQGQRDANAQRIDLHQRAVQQAYEALRSQGFHTGDWGEALRKLSEIFVNRYATHPYGMPACAFLDAVIRKLLYQRGEFRQLYTIREYELPQKESSELRRVKGHDLQNDLLLPMLRQLGFRTKLFSPEQQLLFLEELIRRQLPEAELQEIVFFPQLFYRNKHAYLLGRMLSSEASYPFAIPFIHPEEGIRCDSFLVGEVALKRIFAFSRSYLLTDSSEPSALLSFLLQLMPDKQEEQLIINLGYLDAGRHLMLQKFKQHLRHTDKKIVHAPGIKGMVMLVFTLPDYPLVFKVIRDHIRPPKTLNRKKVLEKYAFVARHDRVGRMADAQLYEYMVLPADCFEEQVLEDLLNEAPSSVMRSGDFLILHQVFTEKKLSPLNLYLQQAGEEEGRKAALDYGDAIKEMAMINIFPGDLLIKNFGVTDEQRVVFYDYDEVCPLTNCHFRKIPEARYEDEMMRDEPWFSVNEEDVFPEEFASFLIPRGIYYQDFMDKHRDLLLAEFWCRWKDFHLQGGIMDLQPYTSERINY